MYKPITIAIILAALEAGPARAQDNTDAYKAGDRLLTVAAMLNAPVKGNTRALRLEDMSWRVERAAQDLKDTSDRLLESLDFVRRASLWPPDSAVSQGVPDMLATTTSLGSQFRNWAVAPVCQAPNRPSGCDNLATKAATQALDQLKTRADALRVSTDSRGIALLALAVAEERFLDELLYVNDKDSKERFGKYAEWFAGRQVVTAELNATAKTSFDEEFGALKTTVPNLVLESPVKEQHCRWHGTTVFTTNVNNDRQVCQTCGIYWYQPAVSGGLTQIGAMEHAIDNCRRPNQESGLLRPEDLNMSKRAAGPCGGWAWCAFPTWQAAALRVTYWRRSVDTLSKLEALRATAEASAKAAQ